MSAATPASTESAAVAPPEVGRAPLCVDLEAALIPVNLLHEAVLSVIKRDPLALLALPAWLAGGTERLRSTVFARSAPDPDSVPLNREVCEWLSAEAAGGRRIVFLSTAGHAFGAAIAARLNVRAEVIDSPAALGERDIGGFDLLGGAQTPAALWQAARDTVVVGAGALAARVGGLSHVVRSFAPARPTLRAWIKAARLHQWVKNVLLLLPALLAHRILVPEVLSALARGFVAFGLCASSVYIVNDLFDLAADRNHARKRQRPFASGALPASSGVLVAIALLASSIAIAASVNLAFLGVLAGYYVLTWAYSLRLKRAAVVDVMTLAALYTLRIIAGSAATAISPSFWLLAFSMFIFISLGCVKRYTELNDLDPAKLEGKAHGRGYWKSDLPLLLSFGTASGYMTIMVMALYLNSPESQALYRHVRPLWLLCPLMLYWISRVWLLTARGEMHDDPIVFALRDRISALTLLVGVAILWVSI